ncbi:unnamed protein product [Staurois parvus]|uniref:Palmitoyltransferase n=1 Tax=Staurois parvus TaxID=386267 RepID=A0ABN9AVX4_9NEOB|nr:unnamed protein product [Staurois parvus]
MLKRSDMTVRSAQRFRGKYLLSLQRSYPFYTRTANGAIRFCDRCQVVKPDRCHHCSVCGMCVLKMDHHCPWVNNCIGFSNYKFFLLFLAYSMLYCLYIASTVFKYFLLYWSGELANNRAKFHVLFLLFVALMFFLSLMFLFGYHCWLVSLNRTTLEAFSVPVFYSGPDKNGFHLGIRKNLEQVFGKQKKSLVNSCLHKVGYQIFVHIDNILSWCWSAYMV